MMKQLVFVIDDLILLMHKSNITKSKAKIQNKQLVDLFVSCTRMYRISRAIVPRVSCKFWEFWPIPGGTLYGRYIIRRDTIHREYRIFKIPRVHTMYNTYY